MVTLEQAARAWTALGRVMYPSLAEVEAALADQSHSTVDGADAHTMTTSPRRTDDDHDH